MKPQSVFLSQLLVGSASALTLPNEARSEGSNSSGINWKGCGDLDFGKNVNSIVATQKPECAKLKVPLDYTSMSSGEAIELQLIRHRATKKPVKGSVIYNPGGPGGSGVEIIAAQGVGMRDILGGHYDLVSFDPRGTGKTLPFVCPSLDSLEPNVTEGSSLARRAKEFNNLPEADTWEQISTTSWKQAGQIADACYEDYNEYGRFIGTAFAARDMISIVDALDQGPFINYWGTSYGTVLGQTFASMFPDRINRMMLDGNLLAADYAATTWIGSPRDTELTLLNAFNECVKAGKKFCPLAEYKGKNTTDQDLMDAFDKVLEEQLGKESPAKGLAVDGDDAVVKIKAAILSNLYRPDQIPTAIETVAMALNGSWAEALAPGKSQEETWNPNPLALFGIACGDSSFRAESADDLYSLYQAHLAQSSFGDSLAATRLNCARWRFEAAEKISTDKLRNIKTNYPVLVLNGMYDPVTPVSHAWEVSARLRNSRVMVYESAGHGFDVHTSKCSNEVVRKYFQEGELPKVGTVCKPDMTVYEFLAKQAKKE
ncbi:hypothetical protein LCI18_003893 [Fusarium solani-melongenae]|uniref:Uncharacterized protein n=1 Tax=Fusarium solani subsp. cucurbitae TaxID=2747967 RepID=A0ACD3YYL9_FUSSC|nr:hypothetical protein LCI18_003893 [Fusarium solani-melongenae]